MAAKKQTKADRKAELERLQAEIDAMPDDEDEGEEVEEDEGSDHIIVFRGKKGLEAFLSQFGDSEDEEEPEEEEDPEEDDPASGEEDEGEEEGENPPPAPKKKSSAKPPVKQTKPQADPPPARKSKWFAERK